MTSIDAQIRAASDTIVENIESLGHDRGLLSRNILNQLRDLVEAVAVRLHQGDGSIDFDYFQQVKPALAWIGSTPRRTSFVSHFHARLQESTSHYAFDGDASERLMLKYYEYLLRLRAVVSSNCGFDILENLDSFPVDLDESLREYHERIAERIVEARALPSETGQSDRYYVNKVRPFFTGGAIYYEVTFSQVADRLNKYDRMIAFTDIDLTDWYAAELNLLVDSIDVFGQTMPVTIIRDWQVSVRPCEFQNFARIFDIDTKVNRAANEYKVLMRHLTATGSNLLDVMAMSDLSYAALRAQAAGSSTRLQIFPTLDEARAHVRGNRPGRNVLRYLMLRMNNRIIKLQYDHQPCGLLSNLRLSSRCIPFDKMPLCSFPASHTPRFSDVAASVDSSDRTHEALHRHVRNNVDTRGVLYTPEDEVAKFGDIDALITKFNQSLYRTHGARKLARDKGHVVIEGYENDTVTVVEELQKLCSTGVHGYAGAVSKWLDESQYVIDDPGKEAVLKTMFADSHLALVYGAAGTGKSTMVNHIANYFASKSKLMLAQTNPAKSNLERRVTAPNTECRTIAGHLYRAEMDSGFDLLVIDEASIVSNADLLKVIQATDFQLLVLVGDTYQIESIRFGNWFGLVPSFVPPSVVHELTQPYRTTDAALLEFWSRVRNLDENLDEAIAHGGYSGVLDESLFESIDEDEIILCLNYDGLYGINNVNRFLQDNNPGASATWGAATYKVGDPVIFNDSERFRPLIYNNLKGRIVAIDKRPERIRFDVSLDRPVDELDAQSVGLEYLEDSTVRFDVYHRASTDEDDDELLNSSVPFQVAYAVSIHKAQGLEFESVKVVVTDANEEDINHNILYTAITRARNHLKIYWTPETQRAVLARLAKRDTKKDAHLLVARTGLTRVGA